MNIAWLTGGNYTSASSRCNRFHRGYEIAVCPAPQYVEEFDWSDRQCTRCYDDAAYGRVCTQYLCSSQARRSINGDGVACTKPSRSRCTEHAPKSNARGRASRLCAACGCQESAYSAVAQNSRDGSGYFESIFLFNSPGHRGYGTESRLFRTGGGHATRPQTRRALCADAQAARGGRPDLSRSSAAEGGRQPDQGHGGGMCANRQWLRIQSAIGRAERTHR